MLAEHNRSNMKKNNLIRFVQSLVFLPVMTMPILFGGVQGNEIPQSVLVQKLNIEVSALLAINQPNDPDPLQTIRETKALFIDEYFKSRNMPLTGTGLAMVDRKSTRLNSSHSQISYAVFCFKKKKIHISEKLKYTFFEYFLCCYVAFVTT